MTSPEERAEFRDFVRRAHPDRGGDPAAFVAGLAELRNRQARSRERRPDPRFDAPVVGGDPPRGLRARLDRLRYRKERKRRIQ
ncbi:hypothetical protein [Actinokineospora iranica]|uniref:J domain-containing protein n=1 Tax=Actinokineospora iranica TaxID=1271860 RepID=A0A1G6LKZ7_9PSEU|nr:hypothetical protein [Actinokineospora iranica]SDC43445.1 hypothetical protein SAMN05216174_102109 [Actinokineospora iranica]